MTAHCLPECQHTIEDDGTMHRAPVAVIGGVQGDYDTTALHVRAVRYDTDGQTGQPEILLAAIPDGSTTPVDTYELTVDRAHALGQALLAAAAKAVA